MFKYVLRDIQASVFVLLKCQDEERLYLFGYNRVSGANGVVRVELCI